MIKKLLEVYKIYFLISLAVFVLIVLANFDKINPLYFIPIFIGAFMVPFLYELDYILYAYTVEPTTNFSTTIKSLLQQKNYKGVFIFAHENEISVNNSIFRSILLVIGVFAVAFLSMYTFSNIVSQTILLTFLLTSIYLQTVSFVNNSYRSWYSFLDFVPKIIVAKIFLGLQYVVYLLFLLSIF